MPVATFDSGGVTVVTKHPMTPEHWITTSLHKRDGKGDRDRAERVQGHRSIAKRSRRSPAYKIGTTTITVYSNCNLHDLWNGGTAEGVSRPPSTRCSRRLAFPPNGSLRLAEADRISTGCNTRARRRDNRTACCTSRKTSIGRSPRSRVVAAISTRAAPAAIERTRSRSVRATCIAHEGTRLFCASRAMRSTPPGATAVPIRYERTRATFAFWGARARRRT